MGEHHHLLVTTSSLWFVVHKLIHSCTKKMEKMKLLMRGSYANTSKALFICYENCFLNWFQLAKNSRVFAKPILG